MEEEVAKHSLPPSFSFSTLEKAGMRLLFFLSHLLRNEAEARDEEDEEEAPANCVSRLMRAAREKMGPVVVFVFVVASAIAIHLFEFPPSSGLPAASVFQEEESKREEKGQI